MASPDDSAHQTLQAPFCLTTLDEVAAPDGCEGIWHRYVITQGSNTIVGMRCGGQNEVSLMVKSIVERLNQRFAKRQLQQEAAKK
jgi:hypothetical protein